MVYSDTSTKQGLLQECEFWTGFGDAGITGNPILKAQFTNRLNRRYEQALSKLGAGSRIAQIDDTNYTNQPFSTFNIVSGQNDYQFLTDADGNTITDITAVLILESTTATDFVKLDSLTLDGVNYQSNNSSGHLGSSITDAELILSPNASNTGVPTGYLERNNTIFFDKIPNYSKTAGGKLFYKRVPSYFTTSDTTKAPGFDQTHHQMLALGASYDFMLIKGFNATLITRVEAMLDKAEKEFKVYCEMRNPLKRSLKPLVSDTK